MIGSRAWNYCGGYTRRSLDVGDGRGSGLGIAGDVVAEEEGQAEADLLRVDEGMYKQVIGYGEVVISGVSLKPRA